MVENGGNLLTGRRMSTHLMHESGISLDRSRQCHPPAWTGQEKGLREKELGIWRVVYELSLELGTVPGASMLQVNLPPFGGRQQEVWAACFDIKCYSARVAAQAIHEDYTVHVGLYVKM